MFGQRRNRQSDGVAESKGNFRDRHGDQIIPELADDVVSGVLPIQDLHG
jgi:hypothetical protein